MTQGLPVRQLELGWKWGWGGGYFCSFATCKLGHAGAHPQTGLTVDPLPAWSEKVFFLRGGVERKTCEDLMLNNACDMMKSRPKIEKQRTIYAAWTK